MSIVFPSKTVSKFDEGRILWLPFIQGGLKLIIKKNYDEITQ